MKANQKRIISVMLALIMLFTAVVPSFAQSNESAWAEYWASEEAQSGIVMFPGADDSQRNFSWYSVSESIPEIRVSLNADLSGAETFTGYSVKTYSGNYANKVTVDGLESGKTYYYQCISGDFSSEIYCFETDADSTFTAMFVTDVHVSYDGENPDHLPETAYNFDLTINKALEKNDDISLILSAGDQASEGLQCEYIGFTATPNVKSIPVATTVGNHDRKGVDYKTFTNMPNQQDMAVSSYVGSNYYFVKNNVLFLVMDSNNSSAVDHRRFVKQAVKDNPDVNWKVMMFHHDLHGGRIPHRESENELLRILWAPIADEFGIDLILMGHSHYYTVSNVLYNNKTVSPLTNGGTVTDPAGTVYMVSGSLNRPRDDEDISLGENVGIEYLTMDKIYNLIDFTEDTLTVKSYSVESDTCFSSFTIEKTDKDGGHSDKMPAFYNFILRFIGMVVAVFNNMGVYGDLTEDGYDVNFFELILG